MSGFVDPALAGIDDVMVRLVSQLCVGAAVLAIARDGELVAARGYGYLDGPPSTEAILAGRLAPAFPIPGSASRVPARPPIPAGAPSSSRPSAPPPGTR